MEYEWQKLEKIRNRLNGQNENAVRKMKKRNDKGMKFLVFSRKNAADRDLVRDMADEPHIWISIYTPNQKPPQLASEDLLVDAKFFCFGDITQRHVDDGEEDEKDLITDDQAQEIVDFVEKYQDQVGLICVNCDAGKSRSSATALALSELLNGHDSGIREISYFSPNLTVKDKIIKAGEKIACDLTPEWYREHWQNPSS